MTYSKFNKEDVGLRQFGRLPDALMSFCTKRYIIEGIFLRLKFYFVYLSLRQRRAKAEAGQHEQEQNGVQASDLCLCS